MWVAPNCLADLELAVVDVDADDRRRAGEPGAGDRGVAHAAAAEHGDRLATRDAAGVDGRADAGHHAAAEQAGRGGRRRGIDLGALAGGDERLLGERTDARAPVTARCRRSSVIFCVALWVLKQYHGWPRRHARQCAAHGPPVEDHVVARRHVGDAVADRLDHAGRLVAEQEREVVVDAALAVVQVGVAHAARLDRRPRPRRARGRGRRWSRC